MTNSSDINRDKNSAIHQSNSGIGDNVGHDQVNNRDVKAKNSNYSENVQGDSIQSQGPTTIIHTDQYIDLRSSDKDFSSCQSTDRIPLQDQENNRFPLGNTIYEDHKYQGKLVCIELALMKIQSQNTESNKRFEIQYSIAFGQVGETFRYGSDKEVYYRFGVKYGELNLNLSDGLSLPLNQRVSNPDSQDEWKMVSVGDASSPSWQFTARKGQKILNGNLCDQILGFVKDFPDYGHVEAVFLVKVNLKNLKITAQDDLWTNNKKKKLTKALTFLQKQVKPELREYVSKVRVEYD